MRTHPTFYYGRLRPYHQYAVSSVDECDHPFQESPKDSCGREPGSHVEIEGSLAGSEKSRTRDELMPARHEESGTFVHTPKSSTHSSDGLPTVRYGKLAPSALTSDANHVRDRALPPTRGGTSQASRALSEVPTHRSEHIFPSSPTTFGGFSRWPTISCGTYS